MLLFLIKKYIDIKYRKLYLKIFLIIVTSFINKKNGFF